MKPNDILTRLREMMRDADVEKELMERMAQDSAIKAKCFHDLMDEIGEHCGEDVEPSPTVDPSVEPPWGWGKKPRAKASSHTYGQPEKGSRPWTVGRAAIEVMADVTEPLTVSEIFVRLDRMGYENLLVGTGRSADLSSYLRRLSQMERPWFIVQPGLTRYYANRYSVAPDLSGTSAVDPTVQFENQTEGTFSDREWARAAKEFVAGDVA